MIPKLISSAEAILQRYAQEGSDMLINCQKYPEFDEVIANLKATEAKNVGITPENYNQHFAKGKVSYFNLREDNDLCIGVFCLSKGT